MELSNQAQQMLRRLYGEGSLREHQVSTQLLTELSSAGMVTLERHDEFNVIVLTEDGRLTAGGGDAPEPDVSPSG